MACQSIFTICILLLYIISNGNCQMLYQMDETAMNFQQVSKNLLLFENMESFENDLRMCESTSTVVLDVLHSVLSDLYSMNSSFLDTLVNNVCKRNPSVVFAHPAECQLYFNCSANNSLRGHMEECSYPDMFSTKTLRCEKFTDVKCGGRTEIKSHCKYRIHKRSTCTSGCAHSAQGPPCEVYLPTCEGLPNGIQSWTWREGSPYYVKCYQERVIEKGTCPFDSVWGTISQPINGKCSSLYEKPTNSTRCLELGDGKFSTSEFYNNFLLCRAYFVCESGILTGVKCPGSSIFDAKSGTCREGQFAHSAQCQLYCDSANYDVKNYSLEFGMKECPYPEMFSEETSQCMNFTFVSCGKRQEVKDGCNYFAVKHKYVSTYSCSIDYPSCTNKSDGLHEHAIKRPGPYFMICEEERFIYEGYCHFDKTWGTQTFPFKGKCTPMFEIPKSEYSIGELPSCEGKADGSYQFPNRKCDAYYKCENGKATGIKCPENTVYDKNSGVCKVGTSCSS